MLDTIFNFVIDNSIWLLLGAKFWMRDGKLLVNGSGQPYYCDNCPCGATPSPNACALCGGDTPYQVGLTFSGIVQGAGSCADCTSLNGIQYVLTQAASHPFCSYSLINQNTTCSVDDFAMSVHAVNGISLQIYNTGGSFRAGFQSGDPSPVECWTPAVTYVSQALAECDWSGSSVTYTPV